MHSLLLWILEKESNCSLSPRSPKSAAASKRSQIKTTESPCPAASTHKDWVEGKPLFFNQNIEKGGLRIEIENSSVLENTCWGRIPTKTLTDLNASVHINRLYHAICLLCATMTRIFGQLHYCQDYNLNCSMNDIWWWMNSHKSKLWNSWIMDSSLFHGIPKNLAIKNVKIIPSIYSLTSNWHL